MTVDALQLAISVPKEPIDGSEVPTRRFRSGITESHTGNRNCNEVMITIEFGCILCKYEARLAVLTAGETPDAARDADQSELTTWS